MPRKLEIDWDEVRRGYQAGISAPDLAKKYGVHVSSIYNHTKDGDRHAGGVSTPDQPRPAKPGGRFKKPVAFPSVDTSIILAALRSRRDALTSAIEAIERLEE